MSLTPISPERWDAVWSADADVLRSLREQGDRSDVPREIDVSFRGPLQALQHLAAACENFGFSVQSFDQEHEFDGEPWLFLVRTQTTDDDAMRELTETYLQIEDTFGVECDGWGCVAQVS